MGRLLVQRYPTPADRLCSFRLDLSMGSPFRIAVNGLDAAWHGPPPPRVIEGTARAAWVSQRMNTDNAYMADLLEVFSALDWWGPGSDEATRRALALMPFEPRSILEIGCGPGRATLTLVDATAARILATDIAGMALDRLRAKVVARNLGDRVETRTIDMAHLPIPDQLWDVIWSEGSAYVMGIENAMRDWRRLLRAGGVLVFSDMVWRTEAPPEHLRTFWAAEYPAMTHVAVLLDQAERAGYRILGHFDMGRAAMDAYYVPLQARLAEMEACLEGRKVLDDLRAELAAYHARDGLVSYEMFVLQKA